MLRYLILGLLRNGDVLHGYGLMKVYRDGTGADMSVANVYRELQQLVALGWVRTAPNPPGADRRRAPYGITRSGAAAFDAWIGTPNDPTARRCPAELSLRAFLVARLGNVLPKEALDRWRAELSLRRTLLEGHGKAILGRR